MPNKPRPENRHRMVRVEDELWEAAKVACANLGTTRAEVMRAALRQVVQSRQAADSDERARAVVAAVEAAATRVNERSIFREERDAAAELLRAAKRAIK